MPYWTSVVHNFECSSCGVTDCSTEEDAYYGVNGDDIEPPSGWYFNYDMDEVVCKMCLENKYPKRKVSSESNPDD